MIKSRLPSGAPPKPLNTAEVARVLGWQQRMYLYYGTAMGLITGGFVLFSYKGNEAWVRPFLLVLIAALVVVGGIVQFRERCPRCATLLGRQSRFVLPNKCKRCGVAFPRPDEQHQSERV